MFCYKNADWRVKTEKAKVYNLKSLVITEKEITDCFFEFKNRHLVGENIIVKTAEKYSRAIEVAPPRLYELYICLYANNGTMATVAAELSYSIGYINKLNSGLVKYLYNYFDKNWEDK